MTMCGLLIPVADGSSISVFDHILADIGDSQSIEQNLSTFSSHTNKVIEILGTADERSLVLLDELGSGTDPVEGAALAISIIRRLMENGAKIMVTTHYQELKVFAIDAAVLRMLHASLTLRPSDLHTGSLWAHREIQCFRYLRESRYALGYNRGR